jgi:ATP-dependent protease ClpP protease subunit
MNEILLYATLDKDTTSMMLSQLSWIGENQVYAVRMYCPGGDVEATWGIPAKMQELKNKGCHSIAKVDGLAASMAGVLLCFFDEREALDVSNIMLHRAMYGATDQEGNPIEPTPEEKQYLSKINSDLKAKMSQVIDNKKLKQLKGLTIDDLFNENKDRVNCWLTAQEAKEIGLITKVIPVDANTSKNIANAVTACYDPAARPKVTATIAGKPLNVTHMTAEEFQKDNPQAYKAIQKDAVKAYKAKAKAALAEDDDPDEDEDCTPEKDTKGKAKGKAKAEIDPNVLAIAVEATLKSMGIAMIENGQPVQTATATATQTAQAATEQRAKAEAEKKEIADLAATLETIKSGKQ